MASLNSTVCGVCESQHVTTDATFWCPECDEGLCSTCLKYHNASKLSRNHEVISVDNYRQLPSFVASVQQYCSDHDKKYQLYCLQHEIPCCPHCVTTTHKKCNLTALDEIVKTSKTSALFDNLEQSLEDLKGNLKRIIEDRENNLSKVQQSRDEIQSEIKTMRDKINEHLGSIEQKILQELEDVERGVNSELRCTQTKLLDHTKTIEELQTNISAIKKYASELQVFVGMKKIETDIEHEEKFVVSLLEDGSLQQVDIDFKQNHKLPDIFSTADYGKIFRIASSPTVAIKLEKNKQAQFLVAPSVEKKTINDINVSSHRKLKVPEFNHPSRFTGCTITTAGKIVLVDWNNNHVFVLNENESLECKINVSHQPLDVTCIGDNTIAITHNYSPFGLEIINISSKQKERQIRNSNACYGITKRQGRLIYCLKRTGIQSVDSFGENASTLVTTLVKQPKMSDWNYVAASKDKLYHTDTRTDTVTCYTISGEKIWEYNDKSVLDDIRGVITDKDANVYVASFGNNSIVIISSDGKNARCLIGKYDGLHQPHGIYLDKARNNLLISCYNGDVHMYKVS